MFKRNIVSILFRAYLTVIGINFVYTWCVSLYCQDAVSNPEVPYLSRWNLLIFLASQSRALHNNDSHKWVNNTHQLDMKVSICNLPFLSDPVKYHTNIFQ